MNAISVWNTVYLQQATENRKKLGKLQKELLNHISPIRSSVK
ncbi:Tn3 family transposase [Paenibacillus sp. MER TA 81-3]